ncbi:MAG TPA: DMT family transporter [Rhodocyclaceae bacterium]|nr:DMT family transporter [Rhodocyclaceae bacterium]
MKTRRDFLQGTLLMLVVLPIWGAFLPASKLVLAAIDPYWFTLIRFGTAALVFFALLYWREGRRGFRLDGRGPKLFVFGAVGFACFGLLVFEGVKLTLPEHGAMILALPPVHVALWQWWRSGRRPHGVVLTCIAAALAGEALTVSQGDLARLASGGNALGSGMLFLASLMWTTYTLGGQQFPGLSPLRFTAFSCGLGWLAIALATAAATGVGHSAPPTLAGMNSVLWPLAFVALVVSVFGILLWNLAVAKLGPLNATLFANFTPVVTYAIALFQGRKPLPAEIFGVALVIGALIANNLFQRSRLGALAQA